MYSNCVLSPIGDPSHHELCYFHLLLLALLARGKKSATVKIKLRFILCPGNAMLPGRCFISVTVTPGEWSASIRQCTEAGPSRRCSNTYVYKPKWQVRIPSLIKHKYEVKSCWLGRMKTCPTVTVKYGRQNWLYVGKTKSKKSGLGAYNIWLY